MKLIIRVFAATWLLSGCVNTPPNDNSTGPKDSDARMGLCEDATPTPCNPPRD